MALFLHADFIMIVRSITAIHATDVPLALTVFRKIRFPDTAVPMDVMGNVPHAQVELAKLQPVKVSRADANLDMCAVEECV